MRFGSVCSGIEAASVAWAPLGWEAAWFSEIEEFPNALLAARFPDVPNYGDMTSLPERILSGEIEAPDILCGGTPCQAFSVAGLRQSLDDARAATFHLFSLRSQMPLIQLELPLENLLASCSGKTSPASCPQRTTHLDASFQESLASMFPLKFRAASGAGQVWCLKGSARSRGESSTLNISECPSDAVASTLSQVLETASIPPRYFLSAKACQGILRLAEGSFAALKESAVAGPVRSAGGTEGGGSESLVIE